jgi:hypothetical protein
MRPSCIATYSANVGDSHLCCPIVLLSTCIAILQFYSKNSAFLSIPALRLLNRNRQGMSKIAADLNAAGATTARGGAWYAGTVRYVLQNGFYAGLSQWDGCEVMGNHPAIISRELYEQAHSRLQAIKPGRVAA